MQPLYLLAAAAKDPPLIDLDSTVFVQLAIFLITALILSRFLFRPYLAVRAARAQGIVGARDEARRMDEEARAKIGEYEAALTRTKVTANAERTQLRQEATERERKILEEARAKTQGALEEARRKLATEATAARQELAPRAGEIARAIASKILGREVA
jgi:F-type H+-transporting ATPase subunit b